MQCKNNISNKIVRAQFVDFADATGPCLARHLAMQLLLTDDEQYFLQIDSHMRFVEHWDSLLLEYFQQASELCSNPVLIDWLVGWSDWSKPSISLSFSFRQHIGHYCISSWLWTSEQTSCCRWTLDGIGCESIRRRQRGRHAAHQRTRRYASHCGSRSCVLVRRWRISILSSVVRSKRSTIRQRLAATLLRWRAAARRATLSCRRSSVLARCAHSLSFVEQSASTNLQTAAASYYCQCYYCQYYKRNIVFKRYRCLAKGNTTKVCNCLKI